MEDVLDLYAEPPDKKRPVVCFDETPRQLIGEARLPVAAKPGKPADVDYEYVRNGTANVFMFFDAHRKLRHAKVTDRRASSDFAICMRDLAYPQMPIAFAEMRYETFPPEEARRILRDRVSLHAQARELAETC